MVLKIIVFLIVCVLLTDWLAHVFSTINNTSVYGIGNFKKFKEKFSKGLWHEQDELYKDYLADKFGNKIKIGEIKFRHKGMLLLPVSYFKARIYTYRYIKEKSPNGFRKGLWK